MATKSVKDDLRKRYRFERKERYLPHTFIDLISLPEIHSAKVVASYISYQYEPDTSELNLALINSGKKLLLPRINESSLEWVSWDRDEEKIDTSGRIPEPHGSIVSADEIDVIIVPALRIDRRGYRLGQGGGFYDRALPSLRAWSIGLIHPDEISGEDLPRESHDVPLNAAATPDLILRFKA